MCLTFQIMTLEKYLTKNFEISFRGYPHFDPSKCGVSENDHPSTNEYLYFTHYPPPVQLGQKYFVISNNPLYS